MKYIRVLPAEFSEKSGQNQSLESETAFSGLEACFSSAQPPNHDSPPLTTVNHRAATGSAQKNAQPVDLHHLPPTLEQLEPRRKNRRTGLYVCEWCEKHFWRKGNGKAKVHRFCSLPCANAAKVGKTYTPDIDKAVKVRANGLVNKRLKLGWFTKPDLCMICNAAPPCDSHHPDYSKPDEVYWVCRSCHTTLHYHPERAAGIPVFVCNDRRTEAEKPKPHGKGGWRGERSQEYRMKRAAVTMEVAREIRRLYSQFANQTDIAAKFGISQMTVSRIVRGERMQEAHP